MTFLTIVSMADQLFIKCSMSTLSFFEEELVSRLGIRAKDKKKALYIIP